MSRGLGWLQRAIIDTLDQAKQETEYYNGAGYYGFRGPGWVKCRDVDVKLAAHVYDLRASAKYLAKKHNGISHANYIDTVFQASFSRAVKGLIDRGIIEALDLVPLDREALCNLANIHNTYNNLILDLADGLYLNTNSRQNRFIIRTGKL
jgi:hypothetical protein